MSKEGENLCFDCPKNCCERFSLYGRTEWQIEELLAQYPFLKLVDRKLELVGGRETMVPVFDCDRLLPDKSCEDYPDNRPDFCERTGRVNRPASVCKLHDVLVKNNPDRCE